jgi:hypothetical protein
MASLGRNFDSTQYDTEQGSTLPLGIYQLEVTASDVVPTKAGNGTILKLTYDVLAPEEFKTRKVFGTMNLENVNAQAQEIGQRELAMLCRALGISEISDSQELHLISFTAKVGLEKPQPGYAQRNKIVKFFYPDEGNLPEPAIDANQPAKAPAPANDNRPAAQQQAARPAATGNRPWGSKK